MEAFKKRIIAVPVMSLVILVSLILTAKTPTKEAVIILLVLLAVFAAIDFTTTSKLFSSKQARAVSIVVGVATITGIGLWGAFAGIGTPIESGGNPELGDTPSAIVTDEAYDLGLFYFERGEYEKAIQTLNEIANNSGSYVEAQRLLAKAIDQYRIGLTDTANTYVEKDDYKLAIEILKAGLLIVPDDAELLGTIEDYSLEYINVVRAAAIEDAAEYAAEEDYANAIRIIWNAQNEVGTDAELDALQKKYVAEYKDFALIEADRIFNAEGYEAAEQFLQKVLDLPLMDSELLTAVGEYKSYAPVSVAELEIWRVDPVDGKCGPSYDSFTDNYGSSYTPCFSWNGSNTYKIDAKYSILTGVFCVKEEDNSSSRSNYLYIWKITNGERDGLLYSAELTGGQEPIEFSVDVSNLDFIEICISTGWSGGIAFVANLFLTK